MTDDLVKRMRGWPFSATMTQAADRIELLEKQLFLVVSTLSVTISEPMTKNWKEFCEALIEEMKEDEKDEG